MVPDSVRNTVGEEGLTIRLARHQMSIVKVSRRTSTKVRHTLRRQSVSVDALWPDTPLYQ